MEEIEIKKIIKLLERKENGDGVEVEHILELVHKGDLSLIESLKELSKRYKWEKVNDKLIVPLASWIDIVCDYFLGGIPKMIEIAKNKDKYSEFSISILEELKNKESIEALVEIFQFVDLENEKDVSFAAKLISSFNLAASFGKDLQFSEEFKNKAQFFLLKALSLADEKGDKSFEGACILSFRRIGNDEIIKCLKKRKPMDYPYLGIEKKVIREIMKRKKTSP